MVSELMRVNNAVRVEFGLPEQCPVCYRPAVLRLRDLDGWGEMRMCDGCAAVRTRDDCGLVICAECEPWR